MKLLNYINGNKKGFDANRIEKDAMSDPFLAEALEGFHSVKGNHAATIRKLQAKIAISPKKKNKNVTYWRVAVAAAVVVFAWGTYLFLDNNRYNLHAQQSDGNQIISIYIPEKFYTENIVSIAKTNSEVMKKHSPRINRFAVDDYRNDVPSELLEAELLIQNSKPIDIYIPEAANRKLAEPIYIAEHSVSQSANQLSNYSTQAEQSDASREVVIIEYGNYDKDDAKAKSDAKPQPIGGYEKYSEYLKTSLRRPTDDICKDKHGKVAVEFSIDSNGKPYNFSIKYSLCGTADKEAVRLILNGPKWTPSDQRVLVKVTF